MGARSRFMRHYVVFVASIGPERLPLLTLTWCAVSLALSPPQAPMFPGHRDLEAQFHAHSEWLWSQWEMHVPAANVIMVPSSTPAAHVREPPCVRQRCSACARWHPAAAGCTALSACSFARLPSPATPSTPPPRCIVSMHGKWRRWFESRSQSPWWGQERVLPARSSAVFGCLHYQRCEACTHMTYCPVHVLTSAYTLGFLRNKIVQTHLKKNTGKRAPPLHRFPPLSII